jgi:predicted amidohydrolase
VLEREEELVYNTTALFGRDGGLIGKYRKAQLYWPESFFYGITPGNSFPVFNLDFGKVGITTCYESWYGDVAKLLALKGAELLIFPNEGYEPLIVSARAIENRVHTITSSMKHLAQITTPTGRAAAQSDEKGLAMCEIEVSNRVTPHVNAGGTLNISAGGRRSVRNSIPNDLYAEIAKEMSSWEDRDESYDWIDDH